MRGKTLFAREPHCTYCGRPFDAEKPALRGTKEHIIPRVLKLPHAHSASNIAAACVQCNSDRGNLTPDELRARADAFQEQALHL